MITYNKNNFNDAQLQQSQALLKEYIYLMKRNNKIDKNIQYQKRLLLLLKNQNSQNNQLNKNKLNKTI